MKPKPYDFEKATKLENYVRKRYRNQLSNGALSFYMTALPYLERVGFGFCKPITADYRELAAAGFRSKSRLREVLDPLAGVLCEIEIGTPIKGEKEATRLRRYSLSELMNGEPARRLIDFAPADARELANILFNRTFVYGDETACRPSWSILRTGRVQSSQPNVQGHPETERIQNLCAGPKPGHVLISCDFKAAEPTLIQKAIGFRFDACPYEIAAALRGIDRKAAKRQINALAYMPDSIEALSFWQCPPAEAAFLPYAEALTAYKEKLWTIGTPRNKKRRYVHTLTGRKIEADRGSSAHRGKILAWQIQGTVADILNAACLKIIGLEASKGWKLCFPEHDAVYVIGTPEQAAEIKQIMEAEAANFKQPLAVKTETFGAGGVVRK